MSFYHQIELASVLLSIAFLVLLMRESIWCWPFGIVGSALGVFLFVAPGAEVKLYSEAVLYTYYVWIGIYGWMRWKRKGKEESRIRAWSLKQHLQAFALGGILTPILGFVMDNIFQSNSPYLDAFTTVFSFIASYMQAEKIFTSWHFWIVINSITIGLYLSRGLNMYSGLMMVYLVLSFFGLYQWKKRIRPLV